jgi:hypothetical protein
MRFQAELKVLNKPVISKLLNRCNSRYSSAV